jgi:hypothetical protein
LCISPLSDRSAWLQRSNTSVSPIGATDTPTTRARGLLAHARGACERRRCGPTSSRLAANLERGGALIPTSLNRALGHVPARCGDVRHATAAVEVSVEPGVTPSARPPGTRPGSSTGRHGRATAASICLHGDVIRPVHQPSRDRGRVVCSADQSEVGARRTARRTPRIPFRWSSSTSASRSRPTST